MSDLDALGDFRMDRTLIEVTTLENADDQAAYWRTRSRPNGSLRWNSCDR